MYKYTENKELRNKLRLYCEEIIISMQDLLCEYFTFSFKLIGSGETRLMMINGKNNSIDLDYNLIIQRDKKQLIGSPNKIKSLFMDALKKSCGNEVKVSDSTSVITCKVGKVAGYNFSFDIAIFVEGNDGFLYKLVNDKNLNQSRYIWNKVPQSRNFSYNFTMLKRDGYWENIKQLYLKKKNYYLSRQSDKQSFSILIETVNELLQKFYD